MPLQRKHWQTVPQSSTIGWYWPAGQAAQAVAGACLEFSFSSFSAAGRLVGVRNGEEGGVDWGMTRPKTDERARKGRLLDFFSISPSTSCVWWPTYCSDMPAMQDPKQMCGFKREVAKKGGADVWKKKQKKNILSSRNHFTPTLTTTTGCDRNKTLVGTWTKFIGPTKQELNWSRCSVLDLNRFNSDLNMNLDMNSLSLYGIHENTKRTTIRKQNIPAGTSAIYHGISNIFQALQLRNEHCRVTLRLIWH